MNVLFLKSFFLQTLPRFFQRLFKGLLSVLAWFKVALSKTFGGLHYTPPQWWSRFSQMIKRGPLGRLAARFQNWKAQNPSLYKKRALSTLASLVVIIGAVTAGWMYWKSRPVPDYVKITATAPMPTDPVYKTPQSLTVWFSKSVAQPKDLNKPLLVGVKIRPAIAGTWTWGSDRRLDFVPDLIKGDWEIGREYTVDFEKSLFASHLIFDQYDVKFSTQGLKFTVIKEQFYIDPQNADIKKVLVNFRANYPVQVEDFKKLVKYELEDQGVISTTSKVPFTMTSNKYQTEIYTQSEILPVPKNSQKMKVTLAKGARPQGKGAESKDDKSVQVSVPSLYEAFGITSVRTAFARNDKHEPEQILVVQTTIQAKSEAIAAALKVHLMPKHRPASGGQNEIKNYQWQSASEITPELLKLAEPIELKLVPSETDWSYLHTFKIQVEPKRSLHVNLKKGLKGIGGYELKDDYSDVIYIENYPQELALMSKGSILTLSGDLKLPLLARNVSQVEFKLNRVIPDQVNHLLYQLSGGEIQNPYIPYGLDAQISESFEALQTLKIESAKATQYFSFDIQPFLNKSGTQKGIFLLHARAKNPNGSYGASDRRLIMITDLGILVKETVAKNHEVFVQNYRTGLPVEGATVEVVGTNGLTVLKGTTDASGRATFPDLASFQREKQPIAFSVRSSSDQAFLPFRNNSRNLSYSRFDISGLYENSKSDQLMSMIFSDRGIYRPSEEVRLGLIVRSKKGGATGAKPPLEWTVTDPRGTEILREKITMGNQDLKDLTFKTEDTSPTGIYTVQVYMVKKTVPHKELDLLGTQTVKVEEFQPDKMKIQARLQQEKPIGWIKPQELKAFVSLKNMFGTAAEKRRVKAEMVLSPVAPFFKEFKDYSFTNLNPKDEQIYTETLGEQTSNEKGEAEFTLDLQKYQAHLFSLRLGVEGFESEGGRSVRASAGTWVSPLDFILGAKADGDLYYINKGSERSLHIIALNSDVKLTEAQDIVLHTIERKYVSVLTQGDDGTYKYQSVLKETPLSEKPFKIAAKGTNFKLNTDQPGDFTLVFRNVQKKDVLKVNYTVVGESNLTKALDRNAELQLSLNKADFKNGEEIQMQIKAPYAGAGLITIERDGVYATKWFRTKNSTTVESIRVPEGLDGNAYVNVTFLRAVDSPEIYASPLSYAVAPFSVSLEDHKTQIKLEAPALVKPGEKLKVQYSANKKTQIILYGVDEGILQVAKYKLPDPLSYFFQKRALQVKTYQMLDLLLPEFSILQQLQATGGDEGFGAIGKNLNPFKSKRIKPVVFWSGVIQADTTPKTYTYDVPEHFNGNMKLMAVAAGREGLGSLQTETLIRGDLIISPNVPMFVAPNDEFVVGVSVSNQAAGSGDKAQVKLETVPSVHFQVQESAALDMSIPEGREDSRDIKVKTLDQLGVGLLTFKASVGKAKAQMKMEVSVRPSTPYLQFLQTGIFKGSDVEIKNPRTVYAEFAKSKVQASTSPFIMASGLLSYLETYPYMCTEQLISRAVPMLALRSLKDYADDQKKMKESFDQALQVLRSRQRSDGGFALYSPLYESDSHVAVSLYAAHFLIEANSKGLSTPEDVLNRVKSYLQSGSVRTSGSLSAYRRWAYSLYLSARLGVVNGASLAQLRRDLEKNYKDKWEDDVTALYLAGTYALYRQEEQGEKLIRKFEIAESVQTDFEDYLDTLNRNGILLYMVGKHYPSKLKNLVDEKSLQILMRPLNQGQYQTHSVGWLLMAFDVMSQVEESKAALEGLNLQVAGNILPASKNKPKTWNLALNTPNMKLTGAGGPLFYSYHNGGFDKTITPVKKGLEVSRQYHDKDGKEVKSVKMGEELTVNLQVRSLDQKTYSHVALVDLIPSGFEMIVEDRPEISDGGGMSEGSSEDPGLDQGEYPESETEDESPESEEGAWFNLFVPKAYAQTTSLSPMQVSFIDEREDRKVLYLTVTPNLTAYAYKIKAVNKGKFVTPPPFAEGLYNRELQFLGDSGLIEIQ